MQPEPVRVYRRTWCEDSDAAVEYFRMKGIEYVEIDIEKDESAGNAVKVITGGYHITPTLVYRMQAIVFDPWDEERFERWWHLAQSE
jgi:glutaredoxin